LLPNFSLVFKIFSADVFDVKLMFLLLKHGLNCFVWVSFSCRNVQLNSK